MPRVARIELLTSAASAEGLPRDGLPQVALVGRSNVGKSSFVNRMLGENRMLVTPVPGTTPPSCCIAIPSPRERPQR